MRALVAVLFAACTTESPVDEVLTDEHGEPLPSAGTALLRAETVVLPAHVARHAIVEWDHVVLPAGVTLRERDVIVSGVGDGFIRRVIRIEDRGDTLRITTSPASLAETVVTAELHVELAPEAYAVDHRIAGGGELLEATAVGELSFAPHIDVALAVADGSLHGFELAIAGGGDAHVTGTLAFTSPSHRSWGGQHDIDKVVFRRAYALGPLPLVIVGRIRGSLAASGYVEEPVTLTSGARGPLAFDARLAYSQSGWSSTTTSSFAATPIGPAHDGSGMASLALGITARFELAFYGTSGPAVTFAAQTGSLAAFCNATRFTGLQAGLFGDAVLELQPLARMERAVIPLWANRIALDELEACTP